MAKPTISSQDLNQVYTTFSENYVSTKLENQYYKNHTTWNWLQKNKRPYSGGSNIVIPVLDGIDPLGDAFLRAGTVAYQYADIATQARYELIQYREPIHLLQADEWKAEGMGAKLRFVQDSIDAGMERIAKRISGHLFVTTQTAGRINSLSVAVDSTGSFGGINPATTGQTWWASQEASMGSVASNLPTKLRAMWNDVTQYKGHAGPDLILGDDVFVEGYEATISTHHEINSTTSSNGGQYGDIGFTGLAYKRCPVERDPYLTDAATSEAFVLNSKTVYLLEKEGAGIQVLPWFDSRPAGTMGRATDIIWCGQLVTCSRAPNGKFTSVSA